MSEGREWRKNQMPTTETDSTSTFSLTCPGASADQTRKWSGTGAGEGARSEAPHGRLGLRGGERLQSRFAD